MADFPEFQAPSREPTFVKPLDTASHRRSRASHDSAAASTRSWVLMTQQNPPPPVEPIPIPDPVPAFGGATTPVRPLPEPPRRTSALDEEYMSVEVPSAAEAEVGYQWTTRRSKSREAHAGGREGKTFVGGFVSGLRRLPRALVRTRRPRRGTEGTEGTEGTGMTGNTLPRYVSNPPTPEVPDAGANLQFMQGGGLAPIVASQENAEEGRRPRHPSFRVVPPAEDAQGGGEVGVPLTCDRDGEGDGVQGEQGIPPLDNPYDHEASTSHHGVLPAPSPHASRADDHLALPDNVDGDEPVSIHARPVPTEDYRRMNVNDAAQPHTTRTTITSASFSADSPSFSSELNGFRRFFNTLHLLPWVATDRVTADYRPTAKSKTLVSWYHPEGTVPSEADPVERQHAAVDLAAASPGSGSASPRNPPLRPRHHRRATTSSAAPPLPYGYPFAYAYPAMSPQSTRSPASHSPRSARLHPSQAQPQSHHRRRRRSATAWVPPPMLLPTAPAPVYIVQPSLPPGASSGPSDSPPGSGDERQHGVKASQGWHHQVMAPVYMQMQVAPGGNQVALTPGNPSGYVYNYSPISMPLPTQSA
ncbi:hypothetical protein B0H10DRAFT_2208177 [Mycena sp. CBHHK59/15]|nr:hypothetical protein B0H10DRAFT_2208177 [Mycena sp. CBHHK59/15]